MYYYNLLVFVNGFSDPSNLGLIEGDGLLCLSQMDQLAHFNFITFLKGDSTMFGPTISINLDGLKITLRPPRKDEMERSATLVSSYRVIRYLGMIQGSVKEDEEYWFKNIREQNDAITWAIEPQDGSSLIGYTSLHHINDKGLSCSSGIMIADQNWWRKGVAYRAHILRTWYAANVLNRNTIRSQVNADNVGSWKALQKVGYTVTGRFYKTEFTLGEYQDQLVLTWINPERLNILFPNNNIPSELLTGIERAKETLSIARKLVQF